MAVYIPAAKYPFAVSLPLLPSIPAPHSPHFSSVKLRDRTALPTSLKAGCHNHHHKANRQHFALLLPGQGTKNFFQPLKKNDEPQRKCRLDEYLPNLKGHILVCFIFVSFLTVSFPMWIKAGKISKLRMISLSFSRGLNCVMMLKMKSDVGLKSRAQYLLNRNLQVWGLAGLYSTAEHCLTYYYYHHHHHSYHYYSHYYYYFHLHGNSL